MRRTGAFRPVMLCFAVLFGIAGGFAFGGRAVFSCGQVCAAQEAFTFNGKNLDRFNGENTFIINCNTTKEHEEQLFKLAKSKGKKYLKVTRLEFGSKATKIERSFINYFKNTQTLVLGKNIASYPKEEWEPDIFGSAVLGKALERIEVAEGNPYFTAIDGVLYSADGVVLYAYPAAKPDSEYVIPDEVVTVMDNAFTGNCNKLERLVLGKKVRYWELRLKEGIPAVTEFVAASENMSFTSENGVLYSKDKKKLLAYPKKNPAVSFTIEEGVEEVYTENFKSDYLTTITIASKKLDYNSMTGLNGFFLPKLKAFSVKDSDNFRAIDGVLYSGNWLVSYPAQKKKAAFRVPDFVWGIEPEAIMNNAYLKTIVLGKSVWKVDTDYMGYGCKRLTAYKTDKKNKDFSTKNGILYDKKKTTLVMYPFGKKARTLTILKSVKHISMNRHFLAKTPLKSFKLEKGNSHYKLNKKKTELKEKDGIEVFTLKYENRYDNIYMKFE